MQNINYLCDGRLGDFIMNLYVVYYNFVNTSRKGNIYFINSDKNWSRSLIDTLPDLIIFLKNIDYIDQIKIYKNQYIDIDLSIWRNHIINPYKCMYEIFNIIYDIKDKSYLTCKYFNYKKTANNYILFHSSLYRKNYNFNYDELFTLIKQTNKKLYFITTCKQEYDNFEHNKNIELLLCKNINEMATIINNSYLFISNLSAQFTFALACGIKQLLLFPSEINDKNILWDNLAWHGIWEINNNIYYYFDNEKNTYKEFLLYII